MRAEAIFFALWCLLAPAVSPGTERSPHELYDAIKALRVDSSNVYRIAPAHHVQLRRGDAVLSFEEGSLTFFSPLDGQITGAVFLTASRRTLNPAFTPGWKAQPLARSMWCSTHNVTSNSFLDKFTKPAAELYTMSGPRIEFRTRRFFQWLFAPCTTPLRPPFPPTTPSMPPPACVCARKPEQNGFSFSSFLGL